MAEEEQKVYDVVIIGGGPGGLSAAMYSSRAKLSTVVLDKNPTAGALGSTELIENYPGMAEPVRGIDLLNVFIAQAERFGARIVQAQVFMVDLESDPKEVFTADGKYYGKTVIVSSGSMGRKPTIKGEAELTGMGVSYCATCDAAFYKDKDVGAIGGLEQVLEEADVLARFARKVYLITPDKDVPPDQQDELDRLKNAEILLDHRVVEILGGPPVNGVLVKGPDKGERKIELSGVFMFLQGSQPIVDFLHDALDRTDDGAIAVDKEDMSTSIPGVFAIGDVSSKRYRQVVIAASDGCIAALSCDKFINKREKPRYQWHKKQ